MDTVMNMNRLFSLMVLGSSMLLACESHDKDASNSSGSGHDGHTTSGGTSGTTSNGTSGATSGGTSGATSGGPTVNGPSPPKIEHVAKMTGSLHVTWTNPTTRCDDIEGERKAEMSDGTVHEPYKVVFTVPGSADNKHDTSATADMKYTYRLRCKAGSAYSEYSNEMSGNPK